MLLGIGTNVGCDMSSESLLSLDIIDVGLEGKWVKVERGKTEMEREASYNIESAFGSSKKIPGKIAAFFVRKYFFFRKVAGLF